MGRKNFKAYESLGSFTKKYGSYNSLLWVDNHLISNEVEFKEVLKAHRSLNVAKKFLDTLEIIFETNGFTVGGYMASLFMRDIPNHPSFQKLPTWFETSFLYYVDTRIKNMRRKSTEKIKVLRRELKKLV